MGGCELIIGEDCYAIMAGDPEEKVVVLHKLDQLTNEPKGKPYRLRWSRIAVHGYVCNCKASQYGRDKCKHSAALLALARILNVLPQSGRTEP